MGVLRAADVGANRTPSANASEASWIAKLRSRDPRAFDALVSRYQRPLYYLALRYVRNEADAADVTQRAFVRVFERIHAFRGASSLRTWIYRIAINLSLNHIRDHKRESTTDRADDLGVVAPVGARQLAKVQRSRQLRAAVATLAPKQKLVIELRIYDELPFREIAQLAECTENAAKVNFHHGMLKLKALLAGESE